MSLWPKSDYEFSTSEFDVHDATTSTDRIIYDLTGLTGTATITVTGSVDLNSPVISGTLTTSAPGESLTTVASCAIQATVGGIGVQGDSVFKSDVTVDGTVTINGNANINGIATTISTTNLAIADKNIVLADGATLDSHADGGGITLTGATNKTITWTDSTDTWDFNQSVSVTGYVSASDGVRGHSSTYLYVNSNATNGTRGCIMDPFPTLNAAVAAASSGDTVVFQTDRNERLDMGQGAFLTTGSVLNIVVPESISWINTSSSGGVMIESSSANTSTLNIYCYGTIHKSAGGGGLIIGNTSAPYLFTINLYGGGIGTIKCTGNAGSSSSTIFGASIIQGFKLIQSSQGRCIYNGLCDLVVRDNIEIRSISTAVTYDFINIQGGFNLTLVDNNLISQDSTSAIYCIKCNDIASTVTVRNCNIVQKSTNAARQAIYSLGQVFMFGGSVKTTATGVEPIYLADAACDGSTFHNIIFVSDVGAIDRSATHDIKSFMCVTNNAGIDGAIGATNHVQHGNINTGEITGPFYIDV
jgi:hypothetical protein